MIKIITGWFNSFTQMRKDMDEMGLYIFFNPYGTYTYLDKEQHERWLSNKHDRLKPIQRSNKSIKE